VSVTITIPDDLAGRLQALAQVHNQSVDDLILSLLEASASEEAFPTPEEVVARIRATPPNPNNLRPPVGSLAEYLARPVPPDPNFNLEEWQREWDAVEAEMKAADRADDIAEGRL
jgi:predicted CopG family antitoxin